MADANDVWVRPSGLVIRRVSGSVFRSGQPQKLEDWEFIRDVLLVDKVVKLNSEEEFSEKGGEAMGLKIVDCSIPMDAKNILQDVGALFERPDPAKVELALETMRAGRCLVHCQHGADRTGLLCALYRVRDDGWSTTQAWSEALKLGYHVEFVGLDFFWFSENAAGAGH